MGYLEVPQLSLDLDESGSAGNTQLSSSPPNTGRASPTQPTTPAQFQEPMELQVDYWPLLRPIGDGKEKSQTKGQDQGKNSVKSTFRNLQVMMKQIAGIPMIATSSFQVSRLPLYPQTGELSNGMTLCFAAKEKKQKSKLHPPRDGTINSPFLPLRFLFQSCDWARRRRKTVTARKSSASMAWRVSFAQPSNHIQCHCEVRQRQSCTTTSSDLKFSHRSSFALFQFTSMAPNGRALSSSSSHHSGRRTSKTFPSPSSARPLRRCRKVRNANRVIQSPASQQKGFNHFPLHFDEVFCSKSIRLVQRFVRMHIGWPDRTGASHRYVNYLCKKASRFIIPQNIFFLVLHTFVL